MTPSDRHVQQLTSLLGRPAPYGVAVLAVAIAWALRAAIAPWLSSALPTPFITFYLALLFAAFNGGLGPGLTALVLGAAIGESFYGIPTLGTSTQAAALLQWDTIRFVVVGLSICIICQQLRRQRQRAELNSDVIRAALGSMRDAVITSDAQRRVTFMNPIATQLTGWRLGDAIGQSIDAVLPVSVSNLSENDEPSPPSAILETGSDTLLHRSGQEIPIEGNASAITEPSGRYRGHIYIFRDVSVRLASDQKMAALMRELQEIDQRKDHFLATLAHELRNPLSPIRSSLHIMKQRGVSDQIVEQALLTIERQTQQLTCLVDDLVDINRISHDMLELRLGDVAVDSVIQQAVEAVAPLIQERQHRLEVQLPHFPVVLRADSVRAVQIFVNLLNNSAKYTPTGGQISIRAETGIDHVVVTVRDTGVGIPADRLDMIFVPFAQVDTALSKAHGGLGIGLSLVKRLVDMHGGSIIAYSDGPHHGAEFRVRLPTVTASPPPLSVPSLPALPELGTILVVDDNEDAANSLITLLQLYGYDAHAAFDGEAGIAAARQLRPRAIVLDIGMPQMDGIEVCRLIRREAWARNTSIIALTGWGPDDQRLVNMEAVFDRHLVKPVDIDELLSALEQPPSSSPVSASIE